jgi:hypothetical protein
VGPYGSSKELPVCKTASCPGLSIAVPALGLDVAVLSRDLHQLADPDSRACWYTWTGESAASIARAKHDLVTVGLSWLEEHLDVQGLVDALEHERDRPRASGKRPWWRSGTLGARDSAPPSRDTQSSREAALLSGR